MAERLIETTFIAALRRWLLDACPERGWMRGLTDPAPLRTRVCAVTPEQRGAAAAPSLACISH